MEYEKSVDESWKDSVAHEKELQKDSPAAPPAADSPSPSAGDIPSAPTQSQESQRPPDATTPGEEDAVELTFFNYLTSLVFQAMIFLGEVPHPATGERVEKDLRQAKFLIDTLILLREKTKGNLTREEENFLNGSLYELQMKYVEHSKPS